METEKWLCLAAMIVAGLVILLYLLDLALQFPFGRANIYQDIGFLVAGGLMMWLGLETWRELA